LLLEVVVVVVTMVVEVELEDLEVHQELLLVQIL